MVDHSPYLSPTATHRGTRENMSDIRSRVRMLLSARRYDEAGSLLREICEKSPNDAQAWFLLGAVYGEKQAFEECAMCSRKAVSIEPAGQRLRAANAAFKKDWQ